MTRIRNHAEVPSLAAVLGASSIPAVGAFQGNGSDWKRQTYY